MKVSPVNRGQVQRTLAPTTIVLVERDFSALVLFSLGITEMRLFGGGGRGCLFLNNKTCLPKVGEV